MSVLTFNVQVSGCALRLADPIADLAQVLAAVVGCHGIDHQRAVAPDGDAGLQGGHLLDGRPLAEPLHRHVARQRLGLARELHLLALQLGLVGWRHLRIHRIEAWLVKFITRHYIALPHDCLYPITT